MTIATTEETTQPIRRSRRKVRAGLVVTLIGFLIFLIGANPGLFGLDRSPVIGFIQLAVILIGEGGICMGGYISLTALWNGTPRSILADIGGRLVATGYVISFFCGMADIFGAGSHQFPLVPYFGELQALGMLISEAIIALGFLMLIPYHPNVKK